MSEFPIDFRVFLTYTFREVIFMAEFCVSCWNELNGTDYPEGAYVLSWDYELCEGCGEYKRVIVGRRRHYFLRMMIDQFRHRRKNK